MGGARLAAGAHVEHHHRAIRNHDRRRERDHLRLPRRPAPAVAPDLLNSGASQRADDIKQYVHGLQEQLAAKGFDVSAVVKRGSVVDTILAVAMAEKVELIAMASHGYTGIARLLHGSVASEVLHRAKVPLLVLHTEDDEE